MRACLNTRRGIAAALLAGMYLLGWPSGFGESALGAQAPLPLSVQAPSVGIVLQVAGNPKSLGERAWDVDRVLAVDIGSRPAGTDAERRAADYLSQQFTSMGYAADLMPFEYTAGSASGTSQNVVARSKTEDPAAPLVIVGAHYDSVPAGPGANDNGSGTSTMVEVARDLAVSPIPRVAVRYVAFGAEEIGLRGSAAYVRTLSEAEKGRIQLVINLDMLAVGDEPQFAGSEPWVTEAMARAASQGYTPRDITAGARGLSDHQSFLDASIPVVMLHAEEDSAYHTARDVIERVQPDLLDLMGGITIGLIRVVSG